METQKLIEQLRTLDCGKCPLCGKCFSADTHKDPCMLFGVAADRLEALLTELQEERYRHDRLQDFEVAEAQELAALKAGASGE